MDHIFAFSHVQTRYLALGPRFGLVLVPQVKGFASRRSFWAGFRDFVILGDANLIIADRKGGDDGTISYPIKGKGCFFGGVITYTK